MTFYFISLLGQLESSCLIYFLTELYPRVKIFKMKNEMKKESPNFGTKFNIICMDNFPVPIVHRPRAKKEPLKNLNLYIKVMAPAACSLILAYQLHRKESSWLNFGQGFSTHSFKIIPLGSSIFVKMIPLVRLHSGSSTFVKTKR